MPAETMPRLPEAIAGTTKDVFTRTYRVRSYETDFRGRVSPVTLLNYLQDAASGHADALGISLAVLRAGNLTWLLSRYHLRVFRYPETGEELAVDTWRSSVAGIYAWREFDVRDEKGVRIACATSSWVLLNLETRRPVRIRDHLPDLPLQAGRALEDDFAKLPAPDECLLRVPFRVRTADLDLNRHVNHAVYAEWALEAVPPEVATECAVADLEIAYLHEAVSGDTVVSRTQRLGPRDFLHQLVREDDGRELTRLRSSWNPAP